MILQPKTNQSVSEDKTCNAVLYKADSQPSSAQIVYSEPGFALTWCSM